MIETTVQVSFLPVFTMSCILVWRRTVIISCMSMHWVNDLPVRALYTHLLLLLLTTFGYPLICAWMPDMCLDA